MLRDEPCEENLYKYAENSDWLLHEAFCLSEDADIRNPYEKHHSTVKNACGLAEKLQVKNLVLYHNGGQTYQKQKRIILRRRKAALSWESVCPR
jgi:ribonuclease Z